MVGPGDAVFLKELLRIDGSAGRATFGADVVEHAAFEIDQRADNVKAQYLGFTRHGGFAPGWLLGSTLIGGQGAMMPSWAPSLADCADHGRRIGVSARLHPLLGFRTYGQVGGQRRGG